MCPGCKQKCTTTFHAKDVNRRLSRDHYTYHHCPVCGLIFLSPLPTNLNDFYRSEYYAIPASLAHLAAGVSGERYKIEIVQRFAPSGRLLEIGPAVGGFAYLAKRAGFEVEAIEMDADCCRFLTKVVGVRVTNSADVCEALTTMKPFNVVAMWHVIEHLPNPLEVLAAVASQLSAGGVLIIAAPNPAAFQFRILRRYWTHLDAPRHLLLLPIPVLTQRARQLGLEPKLITTTDEGSLGWNTFGWQQSLGNFVPAGRGGRITRLPRRIMREIGGGIGRLMRPIERTGLRGSTYTLVLQKGREA